MTGDVVGKEVMLELAKAVQEVWLEEYLVREVLDKLLDKEMLKDGEQQEPGGGEEQGLVWRRDRVGGVETG